MVPEEAARVPEYGSLSRGLADGVQGLPVPKIILGMSPVKLEVLG